MVPLVRRCPPDKRRGVAVGDAWIYSAPLPREARRGASIGKRRSQMALEAVLQLGVTFSSTWTMHGISYGAEVQDGFLLWGSAPASSGEPLKMTRVVPSDFEVVSRVTAGKETVVTAVVSGRMVTVVIPNIVVGALERAWVRVNGSA